MAQSKAALHQAQVNLDYTTIHSPIDGVVISRSVDVGQTVAASLQAPMLFTIAEDLTQDAGRHQRRRGRRRQAEAGHGRDVHRRRVPGRSCFKGKIRQIRNAPQTVQNVVTYDAVIDVDNPDLKLRPGMTANVTFIHAERDDVLRVPNAALRFRPPPELRALAGGGGGGRRRRRARGRRRGGSAAAAPGRRRRGRRRAQRPAHAVGAARRDAGAGARSRIGVTDGTTPRSIERRAEARANA